MQCHVACSLCGSECAASSRNCRTPALAMLTTHFWLPVTQEMTCQGVGDSGEVCCHGN